MCFVALGFLIFVQTSKIIIKRVNIPIVVIENHKTAIQLSKTLDKLSKDLDSSLIEFDKFFIASWTSSSFINFSQNSSYSSFGMASIFFDTLASSIVKFMMKNA